MRISDWSSDVCSSDLHAGQIDLDDALPILVAHLVPDGVAQDAGIVDDRVDAAEFGDRILDDARGILRIGDRSEEHTSELQSLMRISYAVFCLKKKNY